MRTSLKLLPLSVALLGLMLAPAPLSAQAAPVTEAAEPAPLALTASPARDLGLYVGVGLGTNLNLGGGSFGYQLEASVGMFYRMFAVEILGGTTTLNADHFNVVGPHVGAALRVDLFRAERVGLQLGAGARYHSDRSESGRDDRYTGGFASLRLLLPVSSNINLRIDTELEHAFGGPMQGVAANRLMMGFGIETRVSPAQTAVPR